MATLYLPANIGVVGAPPLQIASERMEPALGNFRSMRGYTCFVFR